MRNDSELQQSPRWKSPDRDRSDRDRERERMAMEEQQEHERRRDVSKLLVNVGGHPYIRDGQNIPRDRYGQAKSYFQKTKIIF